ncbi:MAG TPA: biopolymer transporter ExbD [Verrucomicrobiales bacterium]|nr:biopolymer transporter ExbD [Verrucomicrobiales bacterium]
MRFLEIKRRAVIVPIIPLIDILAILLIFFILTSTFRRPREYLPIDIPTVTHLDTIAESTPRVTLAVTEQGEFFLAGAPVDERSLEASLNSLRNAQPEAKLELNADENIPLKTLIRIWEALTASGFPIREVPARIRTEGSGARSEP